MKTYEQTWKQHPLDSRAVVDAATELVVADVRAPLHEDGREVGALIAAAPDMARELRHLVRLLEPKERDGGLDVPGLATLNGARAALKKAGVL